MTYRYSLEKHKNGKSKHICPQCGRKSFVRYIDNLTNSYVNDNVGKCDRQDKCQYSHHPFEYLKDNGISTQKTISIRKPIRIKTNIVDSISFEYLKKAIKVEDNNLIEYLSNVFGKDTVHDASTAYLIGTTKDKAIIYPQIDASGKLRTAKIMQYNPNTGKRLKNVPYAINWMHSILIKKDLLPKNFELKTCLFGEHLIRSEKNNNKIICIVESEKTAIIAATCLPEYLWMSCGSLESLNTNKLRPIKDRKIKLYPDASKDGSVFEKWSKKANEAQLLGYNIGVSSLLETTCTKEQKSNGWDLGDYLIDKVLKVKDIQPIQTNIQDPVLLDMANRNPVLIDLISIFNLELTQNYSNNGN